MKKRTVLEEAYRIYWALGTLVGRASALSGDNDRKIADGAKQALAAMVNVWQAWSRKNQRGERNGHKEENT